MLPKDSLSSAQSPDFHDNRFGVGDYAACRLIGRQPASASRKDFGSFRDRVRLAELPRMDALYPLSRSKDLQQNSLHPELGISLEELGNEKDGMEAVADWPVPRLISCNPALWAGAGDWPAITEDANAVCCPPCSLGKCGDSLAICREAPRASELKLSVAMSTRKECRKIHLAPAVVWPLGRETQRVTLGAVRSSSVTCADRLPGRA